MIHLKYIGGECGHYEVYRGSEFLFSADTMREALHEIGAIPR